MKIIILVVLTFCLFLFGCTETPPVYNATPTTIFSGPTAPPAQANVSVGVTVVTPTPTAVVLSEQPNQAVFNEYFTELSIGKLPAIWVNETGQGKEGWILGIVNTNVFSNGDYFVTKGNVKKAVQPNCVNYNVQTRTLSGSTGGPGGPTLQPGGFAGFGTALSNMTAGNYEYKCYVNGTLVAVIPFKIQ